MDRKNLKNLLIKASSKKLAVTFYCAISILLSACIGQSTDNGSAKVQADRIPDWVLNPPSGGRYIYGVGSAQKFEDLVQTTANARRQANADIASQLRVTVSQSNVQSTQVRSGSNQSEQVLTSLASNTRVETEALALEQSETVESAQAGNYVYVLQRLDRTRVVARFNQEIDELDTQLETIVAGINTNDDVVTQWSAILPALPLLAVRSQTLDMLTLYSRNAVVKNKSASVLELEILLSKLLVALAIQVDSPVSKSGSLVSNVQSALTQKGLTPSDATLTRNGQTTPLRLTLDFNTTTKSQGGRVYVFLTMEAALQQAINQKEMLASWNITGRGVSAVGSQAHQVAERKVAKQLAEAVFTYLTKENK